MERDGFPIIHIFLDSKKIVKLDIMIVDFVEDVMIDEGSYIYVAKHKAALQICQFYETYISEKIKRFMMI